MPRGFRGGSQGKMPKGKTLEIKNVKKVGHAPSAKGPVAGGMSGRPKAAEMPVYGKPRNSTKDCY